MSRRVEIQVGLTVLVALVVVLWGVTWLKEFSLQRKISVWHVRFPADRAGSAPATRCS